MTSDQSWRLEAACIDVDPELFYPAAKRSGERLQYQEPLRICASCYVRAECLEDAYESNDQWAVLGGMSPRQRAKTRAAWARNRNQEAS